MSISTPRSQHYFGIFGPSSIFTECPTYSTLLGEQVSEIGILSKHPACSISTENPPLFGPHKRARCQDPRLGPGDQRVPAMLVEGRGPMRMRTVAIAALGALGVAPGNGMVPAQAGRTIQRTVISQDGKHMSLPSFKERPQEISTKRRKKKHRVETWPDRMIHEQT